MKNGLSPMASSEINGGDLGSMHTSVRPAHQTSNDIHDMHSVEHNQEEMEKLPIVPEIGIDIKQETAVL